MLTVQEHLKNLVSHRMNGAAAPSQRQTRTILNHESPRATQVELEISIAAPH